MSDDSRSGDTSSQPPHAINSRSGGVLKPGTLARVAVYFANFGLSKAAAFLGPLVLAATLDSASYGIIEYAWSWSALVATLLTLGIPAAIPQLSLLRRPVPVSDIMTLCVAGPGALLTLLAAVTMAATNSPTPAVVLSACTIALAQLTLSSYSRTFSHRNQALWFEGLSIYGMTVVALCLSLAGLRGSTPLAITSTGIAAILVGIALILFARLRQPDVMIRLRHAAGIGLPLLAFALSSIWAAVSGRIYIGAFLPIADLSAYSVGFRVASAMLIVHSIVATGLFARLYNMPTRLYDRFLSLYLLALGMLALLMILLFPTLLAHVGFRAIGHEQIAAATSLFPIIALQVYAWGAWASLEMRLARARRSGSAAWKAIVLIAGIAILLAALGITGVLTVTLCASLMALQMLGGVVIQLYTLWRRGMKMRLTAIAFAVAAVIIALSFQIVGK